MNGTNSLANIPVIKQSDNATRLPTYTSILNKSTNDGVNMSDLCELQKDLEKLLTTSAVRLRQLLAEIETLDGGVEESHKTKEKPHQEKTLLRRKRPDEKSRHRDRNGTRVIKKQCTHNHCSGDPMKDKPKVTLPKNEHSDKFWTSIEPFCATVSKDDLVFVDTLLQDFSKEVDINIPDVGEHYSNEWSDEVMNDEQNMGRSPKAKSGSNVDFKKNGISAVVDTFSSPQTQRLLAALIEEKVLSSFPTVTEKLKSSDFNLKAASGPRVGICMDRRLRKVLADLTEDVLEDEILAEIKKCQQELLTVREYNVEELSKLRSLVKADIEKQELKEHLDKVDNQALELYSKIMIAKKHIIPIEDPDGEEDIEIVQLVKEYEGQVDAVLNKQNQLNKKLNSYPEPVNFCN